MAETTEGTREKGEVQITTTSPCPLKNVLENLNLNPSIEAHLNAIPGTNVHSLTDQMHELSDDEQWTVSENRRQKKMTKKLTQAKAHLNSPPKKLEQPVEISVADDILLLKSLPNSELDVSIATGVDTHSETRSSPVPEKGVDLHSAVSEADHGPQGYDNLASTVKQITHWSTDDVYNWLMQEFNDLQLAQAFREEGIDGEVLNTIDSVKTLKDIYSNMTFGLATKILLRLKDIEKLPGICAVRKFKQPGSGVKYIKNAKLVDDGILIDESGPDQEKILAPVREFKLFTNVTQASELKKFVFETIRFITGCLNCRANGTIYFGVEDRTARVIGCELYASQQDFKDKLEESFKICFSFTTFQSIIRHCCSKPKFIEVLTATGQHSPALFVIEVDVESKYEHTLECYFEPMLWKFEDEQKKEKQFFVRRASSSMLLSSTEKEGFIKNEMMKWKAIRMKADEPEMQQHAIKGKCLEELLLFGSDRPNVLDNSTFPILILNKDINHTQESDFEFIGYVKWRVVIDLNCTSKMLDVYNTAGHHTTRKSVDSFKDDLNIIGNLRNEATTCWIFANGNDQTRYDVYTATDWNRLRKGGLWSTILQIKNISVGRGLVVFLFDHDTDGIMSEIYALFVQFFDKFMKIMYIARHENSTELLKERMSNDSEKIKLMVNGIIGLPWKHVAASFRKVSGEQAIDCLLPSSSSAHISVNRKRWSDLTLLGSNECNDLEMNELDQKRYLEERYEFYRGRQVSWINIALSDESKIEPVKRHVVKRKPTHDQLKNRIDWALKTKEKIEITKVFYQPGAGASTLTRHVLWYFRNDYKCAIVCNVTTKTLDQIKELYKYEEDGVSEENLKPVLILLDLPNDDQCRGLLEDMRYQSNTSTFFCVVIHCHKIHGDNQQIDPSKEVFLKQNLTEEDRLQFSNILQNTRWIAKLNAENIPKIDHGYHPDFMLAFLVFQNNFVSDYIKNCVSQYIHSDKLKSWESDMLKYIALLNVYNEEYPEIPGSFFDSLFQSKTFKKDSSANNWWNTLSAPFRLLCKEVIPDDRLGTVKSFMIVHPLLAKEILGQLMAKDKQTLSETSLEFLQSNVFKSKLTFARNDVVERTRNMLKKRKQKDRVEIGDRKSPKFSLIIEDIIEREDAVKAFMVLKVAFDVLELDEQKDPFLAQQIARLCCIHTKEFKEAYKYGMQAISIQNDNSYLLDTMGQIHKSLLEHKFDKYETEELPPMTIYECEHAVELARKAVSSFQDSLHKNQKEASVNTYGIGGEIEVYKKLLILLQCTDVFSRDTGSDKLHRYLHEEGYIPEEVKTEWKAHHSFLKQLCGNMEYALEGADVMLTMMNPMDNFSESNMNQDRKSYLVKILYTGRKSFEKFISKIPRSTLDRFSRSQLNRLSVKKHGGLSFQKIFKLKNRVLNDIWKLLHENVNENNERFDEFDFKALLIVSMAMIIKDVDTCGRINASYIKDLCLRIKSLSGRPKNKHIANLFLSMLMWPRKDMGIDYDHNKYTQVLAELKDEGFRITKKDQVESSRVAEYCNTGKFSTHFKMATHFLLGKNKGLQAFIQYSDLPMRHGSYRDHEFWNDTAVRHKLMQLSGVVKGKIVLAFNSKMEGEKNRIPVKIAFPSNNESEEPVNFYLGFSWGGPIAYNVIPAKLKNDKTDQSSPMRTEQDNEKRESDVEKILDWETFDEKRNILKSKLKEFKDEGERKKMQDELNSLKEIYKKSKEATQMDSFEDL